MKHVEIAGGPDLHKFLLIELIMSAFCNGLINIGMAYAAFGGRPVIPVLGAGGVAFDLVATTFFTGFLMMLVLTPVLRRRVARGNAPVLAWRDLPRLLNWLPRNVPLRGGLVGMIGLVTVAPATILSLGLGGIDTFTFSSLVMFKAGFGAALGVAMAPAVILPAISR